MDDITIFFAAEAGEYLERGNAKAALSLCQKGIETYPDYPLAYVILAQAYNALGDTENFTNTVNFALTKFPGNKIIRSLVDEKESQPVELIKDKKGITDNTEINRSGAITQPIGSNVNGNGKKAFLAAFGSLHPASRRTGIKSNDIKIIPGMNSLLLSRKSEKPKFSASKLNVPPKLSVFEKGNIPDDFSNYTNCFIEMDFADIPEEDYFLAKAKQIAATKSKPDSVTSGGNASKIKAPDEVETIIYTDTIAAIYEMQGAWEQAVKVYENLMESKPEKKTFYESKIAGLKNKF